MILPLKKFKYVGLSEAENSTIRGNYFYCKKLHDDRGEGDFYIAIPNDGNLPLLKTKHWISWDECGEFDYKKELLSMDPRKIERLLNGEWEQITPPVGRGD